MIAQFAFGASAYAAATQEKAAPASSLQELLNRVRNARMEEQALNAEREKTFMAETTRQKDLLKEALDNKAALEARSQQLSTTYDSNDKEINNLNQLLQQRTGNLGELFGVTRQVAGDVAGAVSSSMVSVQLPGRTDFLVKLAGAKSLPNIKELEQLWFEMMQEMTESGRVVKFNTKINEANGESHDAEVVRIGPFIATTGDRYLNYQQSLNSFNVLSRQPPANFVEAAAQLDKATSGYVRAGIDPSRGVLLALTVERPTVGERIQRGQEVGYVIITVGVIGALCALFQFFYLLIVRLKVQAQLKNINKPSKNNAVGRVLLAFRGTENIEQDAKIAELRISEAVLREVPRLERFQSFLRLAVAAGPLLGLIGTVVGMIITFQSITESGSSDPKLMAAGIGQAMIATVLGLGIAIPLLFANAGLTAISRGVVQILDEQSAGLLAESLEKSKSAPNV